MLRDFLGAKPTGVDDEAIPVLDLICSGGRIRDTVRLCARTDSASHQRESRPNRPELCPRHEPRNHECREQASPRRSLSTGHDAAHARLHNRRPHHGQDDNDAERSTHVTASHIRIRHVQRRLTTSPAHATSPPPHKGARAFFYRGQASG